MNRRDAWLAAAIADPDLEPAEKVMLEVVAEFLDEDGTATLVSDDLIEARFYALCAERGIPTDATPGWAAGSDDNLVGPSAWLTKAQVAATAGISVDELDEALMELEAAGFVRVLRTVGPGPDLYQLRLPGADE